MKREKPVFRYHLLAEELADKIRCGLYKPDEKLPSTRELHRKLNLSLNTVYKAYIELEKKNLVVARPKSGFYVNKTPWTNKITSPPDLPQNLALDIALQDPVIPHSVTIPSFVNQVLKTVRHPDFLPLGTAMISPELLPFQTFNKIVREITDFEMKRILTYSLAQGDLELRRQLSLRSLGILRRIDASEFVITNGCTEALSLALQAVTQPGNTIAIESPAFYGVLPLIEELDLNVVEIDSDVESGLCIPLLEGILRKHRIHACLLTPNFHNPLGSLMTDEKKKHVVQLLNSNDIPIIEDNINSELYYGKERPLPLKAFDRKEQVILCSSFSKTLAPGFRIGWIIPGKRYFEKVLKLKAGFSVSSSSLDQYILARFMEQGNYERYLRSLRNRISEQIRLYTDCLKRNFPENSEIRTPKGGILLWIKLPGLDGFEIYEKALKNRISILPGSIFSTSGEFKQFIRIGCGFPFTKEVENGLANLGDIIKKSK